MDAKLESTFTNIDIAFSGGESTKQATDRAISLIQDVLQLNHTTTLLVTHGNLLTLILKHFNHTIGFNEWRTLTNPDIYEITIDEQCIIKRLWKHRLSNIPFQNIQLTPREETVLIIERVSLHMYEDVLALLHKTNVSYEKFEHEPVLDYETDRIVRERLGLQGTPSKSLF